MYVNTRVHKICFIKCFYEKFIEHKTTQASEFVFYIDNDKGFLNMFYFKQICKII